MTADSSGNRKDDRLGAEPVEQGRAELRVWAPEIQCVEVDIEGNKLQLQPEANGFHAVIAQARLGARYQFLLDGRGPYPDPCSRSQPDGVRGASELIDTSRFARWIATWAPPSLEELVIYELHVGTFTQTGTFDAVIDRLPALRELGVRAIELMPIATFPGRRGWGYDGLYTSAPHVAYGQPGQLAHLIGAAHRADLGVIVDVVYNHLGPGSEALTAFGPYLSTNKTLWGGALDYSRFGVREWAIQNAELWVREFRVDGLRIDAAHAVFDAATPHVLVDLATRVHAINQRALVISEMQTGDLRPIEQWGHDAQWADELHHAIHALLTGESDGYYQDYGSLADLAWALERPQRERLVVSAQNHDQVGNRALGDRLHGAKLRLAAFCVLLSSGTPLVFMGEEYDEQHPFQFFTDHIDPAIATATHEGRRREFAAFVSFSGKEIPDPQAEEVFLASKLERADADDKTGEYYRDLIKIRRQLIGAPVQTSVDESRRIIRVQRGATELVMNSSNVEADGVAPWSGVVT